MSIPDLSATPRTALRRHRERGRTERDDLFAVLDAGLICHLGVIAGGAPRTPRSASPSRTWTAWSAPGRCSATR